MIDPVPLTYISCSTDFVKILGRCFSLPVIARTVKPCIDIVLDLLFEHALWQSALDLQFVMYLFCPIQVWIACVTRRGKMKMKWHSGIRANLHEFFKYRSYSERINQNHCLVSIYND